MQRPSRAVKTSGGDVEAPLPSSIKQDRAKASRKGTDRLRKHPVSKRYPPRCCGFGVLLGVATCYLQLAVNFVALYHYHGNISWHGLFAGDQKKEQVFTTSELLDKLSTLSHRVERLLQIQAPFHNPSPETLQILPYQDDGKFLAFTIRDARRTVPTQINLGFHVFDFVDVHNPKTYYSIENDDENSKEDVEEDTIDPLHFPAPLFHNGFPVPYPYNVSTLANATGDCQEYSLACYRFSLIQVMRYLLEAPQFRRVTHFFYMESDHTLCTTLAEVRSIAYEYQRYVIAAGTGTSGWIMSRRFVQDFFEFYRKERDDDEMTSLAVRYNITREDCLKPDVVASIMLRNTGMAWSVTRRYVTSHTILSSTGMGVADMSLTELFEFEKLDEDGNSTASNSTNVTSTTTAVEPVGINVNATNATTNATENTPGIKADPRQKKEVAILPPLIPKNHLPRCLEPHRGVLDSMGGGEDHQVGADSTSLNLSRLDLFDYDRCPDAMVFPCEESDLRNKHRLRGAAEI